MTAGVALILASGSVIRAQLLTRAGVAFEVVRPSVDEALLKTGFTHLAPKALARALAEGKARSVAAEKPEAIVIGADQVLDFEGRALDKPPSRDAARAQLLRFRGKTHKLETAICCCRRDKVLWAHEVTARLTMRDFSDAFLDAYLAAVGDDVTTSVGGYKLEERGIQLFAEIDGDYFGILGLPLLSLLGFLRNEGVIQA